MFVKRFNLQINRFKLGSSFEIITEISVNYVILTIYIYDLYQLFRP